MKKTDNFYTKFENDFRSWANEQNDIRAAFVVGSRSRVDHSADQWSDLDIIIYANNCEIYLSTTDWLAKMGDIWITFTYHTSSGEPERLTLFEGGFQVDLVFLASNILEQLVNNRIIPDVFCRGARILVDKDNVSKFIVPSPFKPKPSSTINETAFLQVINMFWFGSIYVAKQILRGELWTTKTRDNDLKILLLQMVEWHAKAMNGEGYDVWHAGRFLSEWVDQETFIEIKNTFGHYEKTDSFRALIATMNLFRRLSIETANKLQLGYPTETDKNITNWINQHFI